MLLLASMISLSGCGLREFFATLGFDTHDYEGEEVIASHEPDSEMSTLLADMVKILTVNSPEIPEFKGTKEGIECCRDAILNSMYSTNFAKYAGNSQLFKEAEELYPQMDFSVLIPADDFENTAYKYFGGKEKITNESGEIYEYIENIDAYITVAKPVGSSMEVQVVYVEETERTYRMEFESTVDGESSGRYYAMFIKRDDGT
ncbi:MAG: hypothetical protein IJD22_00015, partial [Clostridia bacterium]|nr:hypothetical protein [Clostridia bacterium]